jgi:hypothetical protein
MAEGGDARVRAQDRDELARLVTAYNAGRNGVSPPALEVFTEPLLAGPEQCRWDLILTNIPAKAGKPVLEDFVRRSAGLLAPGGRVMMVAVHTLADFFTGQIAAAGAELLRQEESAEHAVFVYGPGAGTAAASPLRAGAGFAERYPFYARNSVSCLFEDIPLRLETVYGASGFDAPGGAAAAAAKLIRRARISPRPPQLVHEPEQGFCPCWLLEFARPDAVPPAADGPGLVLSVRNILALEAARRNVRALPCPAAVTVIPAADLPHGTAAGGPYGFIAVFPGMRPPGGGSAALWETLPPLLADGGVFVAAFSSAEAARFDRKKPAGFNRLGDLKRGGFRALGYKKN